MTDITTFTFDADWEQDIRVLNQNGEPLFAARDVALILGYSDTDDAIRRHCKYPKLFKPGETPGLECGPRGMKFIPESDLYRLIFGSHAPDAERFRDWVVEEVLPTIRKTGGTYMTDDALIAATEDPDFMIGVLQKLKQVKSERDEAIRTKAMVAKGREGTLFSKVGNLTRENKRLVERYENPEFLATTAIPWLKDLFTSAGTSHLQLLLGQELKEISKAYDLPHHKMSGSRWPITLWHRDAIEILRRRSIGGALRPKLRVYLKN
jgi:prophage antirepressor-like protein